MKKLLVLMLLSTLMFAKNYKEFAEQYGYEIDFKTTMTKAKAEKKDIFFVLVANYCPWCKKLEKRKLAKAEINDLIHKKYVPIILNREEHNFPKQYESPIIPVVYIIDYKNGDIKKKSIGYTQFSEFLKELH